MYPLGYVNRTSVLTFTDDNRFDISKWYQNLQYDMDLAQMRELELETSGRNTTDSKTSEDTIVDEPLDTTTADNETSTGPGELVSAENDDNQESGDKQESDTDSEDSQQEKQPRRGRKKKAPRRKGGTRFGKCSSNKKKKRK
jgi:hypothetical protein